MANDDDDEFGPRQPGAYARGSDPQPSHDAAANVPVTKLEGIVMGVLEARPGGSLTTLEISHVSGVDKWSVTPRMKPLERKGKVERSTKKGLNSSGRETTLTAWRAIIKEEF